MTTGPRRSARRALPRIRLHAPLAVLAVLIVAVCAVDSMQRIGKPFPGFFVWENLFVPAVGETSWTGAAAGLEYRSWIVAVDGEPVRDAHEFHERISGRSPGQVVRYTLLREGRTSTLDVPMMVFGARAFAMTVGIYLLNAVALLVLGIVVLCLKPGDRASQALFLFCSTLGLYMATSVDLFGAYRFRVPYFLFAAGAPTAFYHMLSHFPEDRKRSRGETAALGALVLWSVGLGIASNLVFYQPEQLLLLDKLAHIYIATTVLTGPLFFIRLLFKARSRITRQRVQVVLLGFAGAFTFPGVMLGAIYARDLAFPLSLLTISFVVFPLGIAYAIGNHELRAAQAERVRKERLAVISELSGAMAHAIRNPLAGIRAAAQLAILELDGHPTSGLISDVVSEADRLNDRINALLAYSRPFQPESRTLSLRELTARAVRDTESKATQSEVRVRLESPESLPKVRVDPMLVEEAAAELISNAIDASPPGSEVRVRLGEVREQGASWVWLEVQDSGPGLDDTRAEKIFDLFYTTKPRGTGFGLATVRKIIEGHGGRVSTESREGAGACFRIVLPVDRPADVRTS